VVIAFTGHRPNKLGGYSPSNPTQKAVRAAILTFLRDEQPSKIISGMALGVDQWAAEAALELAIPFTAAIPFRGFDSRWSPAQKSTYRNLLSCAATVFYVCATYSPGAYQARNMWMVDHCDLLAAIWDDSSGGTANCINYARRRGVPVRLLDWSAR
jgi:uncharacterized phage-like protein YoqJ